MVYSKTQEKSKKKFGGSSFIKRATSFLMSLVMVSGIAFPELSNHFTEEAYAASVSTTSSLDFQRVLGYLPVDGTDPTTSNSYASEAVYLAWNAHNDSGTFSQVLTYHMESGGVGYENTITVERPVTGSTNAAKVTYTSESLDGNNIAFDPYVYLETAGQTYVKPTFDGVDRYTNFYTRDTLRLSEISPEPSGSGYGTTNEVSMTFFVEEGSTFSFKYGETLVTFRLATDTQYFHVYIDNLAISNNFIYDFKLEHNNSSSTTLATSYLNVHLGINDSTVNDPTGVVTGLSMPFDSGMGAFVADSLTLRETGIWADQIDYDNRPLGKPDDYIDPNPGSDVGIYVNIPIPKAWDDSSKTFTEDAYRKHTGSTGTKTVTNTSITMRLSNELNFTINGFGTGSEFLAQEVNKVTLLGEFVNNFYTVKIEDLAPSTIYDDSYIYLQHTNNTNQSEGQGFHNTNLSCGKNTFYTFLAYEIQNRGPDQFMAVIEPYTYAYSTNDLTGYYRLYLESESTVRDGRGETDSLLNNDGSVDASYAFAMVEGTSGTSILISLGNILGVDYDDPDSLPSIRIGFSEEMFTNVPGAGSTEILSQILNYVASSKNLNLGVPSDLTITNSQVVYGVGDTDAKLLLDLEWDIVNATVLQYLFEDQGVEEVIFPLSYRSTPDQEEGERFLYVKLTDVDGFPTDNTQYGTITLDTDNQNLIDPPWNPGLDNAEFKITFVEGSYANGTVKISIEVPVTDANISSIYDTFFSYPGTYFLTVENEYWVQDNYVDGMGESSKATLTLNGIETSEIPAPSGINAYVSLSEFGEFLTNSLTVEWNKILESGLSDYVSTMLYPRNLGIDGIDSMTYNLYISHTIDGLSKYAELRNAEKNDQDEDDNLAIEEFEAIENSLIYSDLAVSNWSAIGYEFSAASLTKPLRNSFVYDFTSYDSILVLEGLTNTDVTLIQLILNNLDANQTYFFAVDTQLQAYELALDDNGSRIPDGSGGYEITDVEEDFNDTLRRLPRRSKLSSIVTATTLPDYEEPDANDISPEAPTGLDKKDISLNEATIFWDRFLEIPEDEQTTLGFEILRLENYEMIDSLVKDTDLNFSSVWKELDQDLTNPAAYNIFDITDFGTISSYSILDDEFNTTVAPSDITYEYFLTTQTHEVTDYSLSPNRLYFYYVRTVKYRDEGSGYEKSAYSIWMPISVTTEPVQSPINLIEEREKSPDRETKVAISFDAPVDLRTSGIAEGYKLQYSIKLDGEDWQDPVTMEDADLTITTISNPEPSLVGYTHYDYLIEGLLPGTSYSVKVRLWDTELDDFSSYSNILYTRTDINQDDLNNYEDTTEWLEILQDALEDLKKTPYWILNNSDGNLEAIYRDSMFGAIIDTSITSSLQLGTGSGNIQTFYISADSLLKAQQADKNFTILNGNLEVLFPSISFDSTIADGLITAAEELKNKNITDYYIKLSVVTTEVEGEIDGKPNVSPKYTVTMEVIATSKLEATIDNNIEDKFLQEIVNVLSEDAVYQEFSNKVSANISSEEVIQYVNEIVRTVWNNFSSQVQEEFSQAATAVYPITTLTSYAGNVSPIKLSYTGGTTASINGYYLTGNTWNIKNTTNVNGVFSFTTTTPGIFIFAGSIIEIPNIGTIPGAENITAIVAKYALDDLFGKGENFDLKSNATTYMVLGSLARIGGASKDMSVTQWYQSKGITISTRTIDQPISTQNAIYYMMLLYEDKTNSNVSAVKINNMAATSNMLGLTDNVKPYMAAAVQMGLVTDNNLNASKNMTVEEFLRILETFSKKVTL